MNPNFERGSALFDLRRFPEAAERLVEAIHDDPEFAPTYALLGAVHINLGNVPAARAAAKQALNLDPDYPFAHYIFSLVLRTEGEWDAAALELACAQELSPEEPVYFAAQAELCFAREHWWQALEWAEQGLEIQPEHCGCMEQEIQALMQLELFDRADEAVLRYLRIDPNSAEGHRRKGWLEFRKGNQEAAIQAFRCGAELAPQDGDALIRMAQFAEPAKSPAAGLLKRVARTLHLPHWLQFALILAPTIFFVAALVFAPDNRVLAFVAALWTALTTATFGAAFILQTIDYDVTLSAFRTPLVDHHATRWQRLKERMVSGLMVGLGVLFVGYIYLIIVLMPFFMRHTGIAVLLSLSGLTGYRALRQQAIRSAYSSRGRAGLASWFVRSLAKLDLRFLVICCLVAGVVGGIVSGKFESKPAQQKRPTPNAIPDKSAFDQATCKAFDAAGKQIRVGEAARKLFGLPPAAPEDESAREKVEATNEEKSEPQASSR